MRDSTERLSGSKKLNLYFDLDGTLIDISNKRYKIYRDICTALKVPSKLPANKFWERTRNKSNIIDIEGFKGKECLKRYKEMFYTMIEEEKYLSLDRCFPETLNVLKELKKKHRIILTTLRRSRFRLLKQLQSLEIMEFIDKIIIPNSNQVSRREMIAADDDFDLVNSVIIGDTEAELMAARKLKCDCILVTSGMRSREFLSKYKPAYLLNGIRDVPSVLNAIQTRKR